MIRVGIGYDVHQLVENRPLIIGGICIPYNRGLAGHSDADVLTHAITDAMLGALALGTIGDWFPDTDPTYTNADSIELLQIVMQTVGKKGYVIGNIDSVLIAEYPKFKPYVNDIQQRLMTVLGCNTDQISIKATTTETLGFEGRQEGIAAQAVVLLQRQ